MKTEHSPNEMKLDKVICSEVWIRDLKATESSALVVPHGRVGINV